jgi:GMP synthase (glutamine-hydrolysing)
LSTPLAAELLGYAGVIISGGPQSVYGADAPVYDPKLFTDYKGPILGICYGMQLINHVFGGRIQKGGVREDGQFLLRVEAYTPKQQQPQQQQDKERQQQGAPLTIVEPRRSALYDSLPDVLEVLLTHGDSLTELAPGFHTSAVSASSGICASIEHESRPLYGVQYHPEVDLTPQGSQILANFLDRVCRIPRTFTLESRKHAALREIRTTVGAEAKVLCLLSGGVDSSVCAALLKEAIGAERVRRALRAQPACTRNCVNTLCLPNDAFHALSAVLLLSDCGHSYR